MTASPRRLMALICAWVGLMMVVISVQAGSARAELPALFVPDIPADRGSEKQFQRSKFAAKDAQRSFRRRRYKSVLSHAESAWEMYKSPTYAFMIGVANDKLGRSAEALKWLVTARAMNPPASLRAEVDATLGPIAKKFGHGLVALEGSPDTVQFLVTAVRGELSETVSSKLISVAYGDYTVTARADGFQTGMSKMTVSSLGPVEVSLVLQPKAALPDQTPNGGVAAENQRGGDAAPEQVGSAGSRASTDGGGIREAAEGSAELETAGWVTFGTGLALTAGGAGMLVWATAAHDGLAEATGPEDFDTRVDDRDMRAAVGWAFVGIGAAAAIGGLVMALVSGDDAPTSSPSVGQAAPSFGVLSSHGSIGVFGLGRF